MLSSALIAARIAEMLGESKRCIYVSGPEDRWRVCFVRAVRLDLTSVGTMNGRDFSVVRLLDHSERYVPR
jgi:hypothetical protein